jgi:hypothetical protein
MRLWIEAIQTGGTTMLPSDSVQGTRVLNFDAWRAALRTICRRYNNTAY